MTETETIPDFDDFYETVREGEHDDEVRADTRAEAWDKLVPKYGIERVWSIVEGDDDYDPEDDDEDSVGFTWYALPGVHVVNVLYYVVSTEPVRQEHTDTTFTY
jgi:hypothetical protein